MYSIEESGPIKVNLTHCSHYKHDNVIFHRLSNTHCETIRKRIELQHVKQNKTKCKIIAYLYVPYFLFRFFTSSIDIT